MLEGDSVVFEALAEGMEPAAPQALGSATASFLGLLAQAAHADGLLDLDARVSDTLPELASRRWGREMRVRQLLDYTSGLESGIFVLADPPGGDRTAAALGLELIAPPGERFQFGPSHAVVFGEVLRRRLAADGRDPDPASYLQERVLAPAGIAAPTWSRDARGIADLADGAALAPRDWARFGALLRDHGRVGGKAVLAPEAVADCLVGSSANPGFGLGVWLNPAPHVRNGAASWSVRDPTRSFYPPGMRDLVVAAGGDGQRLYSIGSLDLVIVRFGVADRSFRDEEFLAHVAEARAVADVPPGTPAPPAADTAQP